MTFGQVRFIKRVLLILFLGLGIYVGRHVWEGVRARESSPSRSSDEPDSPVSREVAIEQLDSEGRTAWTLKAAESIGRTESAQQFRDVEIRFDAGEDKIPVVVTADHCEVQKDSSVFLEGNVVVRDETSLRLEANTLHFERAPDRAWSSEPVRYFKKGLTGSAGSMRYRLEDGALELEGGVDATFREEGDAPLRVESMRASMRRRRHFVQFVDEVRVRQANRALDCNDLQVYLDEENEIIERMEAYESVDLRMDVAESETSDSSSSASLSSEAGTKRLLTEKLEAFFRPGGEDLERVRALEGGRLIMKLPPGAREGYHKDLEGYTLVFEFDEEGRLDVLRGRGGVSLVLTPVASEGEAKKIVNARQLEAFFDPVSGDLREAICEKAVTFEQGDVRATAEKGTFRNLDSKLVLEDEPRLWDRKASLEATVIEIDVASGDVEGTGSVRSTSTDTSGPGLFPAESDEPVYFVSKRLRYVRATDTAVYTGEARGIQGQNRIEAGRIRLLQGAGELAAENGVKTTFLQKPKNGDPEVTVTDADTFHYRSKDETLQYQGGVAMRSKELTMKGKKVDVMLEPVSREVREVLAEGEVTIETPDGKAAGEHARYLPEEESMTVRGESARLENAGKLTEGKQLTFFLTDDRILVDGREQTRTKTTYTSKPRL